jgi:glycosyltransferase involved in cell wall biosynthesis
MSGGLEHFTAGLVAGLVQVTESPDEIIVSIAKGSQNVWESRAPASGQVRYLPVAAAGSVVQASLKLPGSQKLHVVRDIAMRASPTRYALSAFRRRVEVGLLRKIQPSVVYYPIHRHEIQGHPAVITTHDLRSLQPELHDARAAVIMRQNIAQASATVSSWPHPFGQLVVSFPDVADHAFMIPFPVMNPPLAEMSSDRAPDETFLLYPASTGKHKNHLTLIEAMALLNRGRLVRLVCTGAKVSPTYEALLRRGRELGVSDLIEYRGFVGASELDALYRKAAAVVVPSRWEAASGPIFEAFAYGRPVACSDIAPIRSQIEFTGATVGFFDPLSPTSIAEAVGAVLDDPEPFAQGSVTGAAFLGRITWSQTALDYLAVWRWVASGKPEVRPILSAQQPRPKP